MSYPWLKPFSSFPSAYSGYSAVQRLSPSTFAYFAYFAVHLAPHPRGTTPWRLWDGFWDDLNLQNRSVLPSLGRRDGSKGTKGISPPRFPGSPGLGSGLSSAHVSLLPRRSRRRVLPQAEIKVIQAKSRPEHFSCAAVPKHRRSPGYFLFLLFLVLVLRYALVTPCVTP